MALQNDLALSLAASPVRILAPVPGRPYLGVEVPNKSKAVVPLRGVLEYARAMVAHETSARIQLILRQTVYDRIVALGPSYFGTARTGDVASWRSRTSFSKVRFLDSGLGTI